MFHCFTGRRVSRKKFESVCRLLHGYMYTIELSLSIEEKSHDDAINFLMNILKSFGNKLRRWRKTVDVVSGRMKTFQHPPPISYKLF